MDDFRDLMYDLILESLVDKLDNYEITMEDAELFSEAAYDELFYEDKADIQGSYDLALANQRVRSALGKKKRKGLNSVEQRKYDHGSSAINDIQHRRSIRGASASRDNGGRHDRSATGIFKALKNNDSPSHKLLIDDPIKSRNQRAKYLKTDYSNIQF